MPLEGACAWRSALEYSKRRPPPYHLAAPRLAEVARNRDLNVSTFAKLAKHHGNIRAAERARIRKHNFWSVIDGFRHNP